jgi:SCY1-like protein 1
VLSPIIKIGNILSSTEYEQVVVTSIVKMFAVPDRAIRLSLLESLGSFIDKLSNKIVNDQIFQHVVSVIYFLIYKKISLINFFNFIGNWIY